MNKVKACAECNHLKGDLLPEEFAIYILHHLQEKTYFHFGKVRLETILKNTNALVEKIKPYRRDLFKSLKEQQRSEALKQAKAKKLSGKSLSKAQILDEEYKKQKKDELLELVASFPPQNPKEIMNKCNGGKSDIFADKVPSKSLKEHLGVIDKNVSSEKQVEKLRKKYPFVFNTIADINPDLPRWLFDNVVNNKHFLTS